MAVMGVWAFILCTGHRWHKTKEQKTMKQYKADFPWTENKEASLLHLLCPVHEVLTGIWNSLISEQIVNSFGQGKCSFDCQSGNLRNYASSQQAHACWELKNWSPLTWLVFEHFVQIHSWLSIYFSCLYTNNYKHFHKYTQCKYGGPLGRPGSTYPKGRLVVVLESEYSEKSCVRSGVLQGTVLGLLCFLSFVNDIGNDITSYIKLFADDTLLMVWYTIPTMQSNVIWTS